MKHGKSVKDGTLAQSESVHEARGKHLGASRVTEAEKSLKRRKELQMVRAWIDLVADRFHLDLEELLDEDVDGKRHPVE